MKLPAIRAKIGDWTYYISRMKFSEVSKFVKKIDQELHKSETLSQEIQRAISSNYISIKDYILRTQERFLGSLVLAVYDGNPNWIELRIEYEDDEFFEVGFLELSGKEKIFPVDGQHRVEGIKAAVKENEELSEEVIPVIFIGHNSSDEGMQRTRRLFTTLNRYAKPVKLDDIIALDEDDIVAIVTRNLIEDYILFSQGKVVKAKQKAIPDTNKTAFTSIISLYQTNLELFKGFYKHEYNKSPTKKNIEDFLKVRPAETIIDEFQSFITAFWDKLIEKNPDVNSYIEGNNLNEYVRNSKTGGNLLFRPVGLEAFAKAVSFVFQNSEYSIENILTILTQRITYNLSDLLWKNILWNSSSKKMIMHKSITSQLFIYAFDKSLLSKKSIKNLSVDLQSLWNMEDKPEGLALDELDKRIKGESLRSFK
ncbi:MAG: DNA sulfur modification protein DndB [Candidatus Paceibacterota bacterium]